MMIRHRWNIAIVLILLAGVALIGVGRVSSTPAALPAAVQSERGREPAPQEDHPAPDFRLETIDGTTVSLSDLQGQVVLVNIWATWCPPCRAEMPMIEATYRDYSDDGFVVLAVNMREDRETVASYMQQSGLTFPALLDRDGTVSADYRANVVPSSFFVDRRGVVRAVYRGPLPRSVIAGTVEALLAETP